MTFPYNRGLVSPHHLAGSGEPKDDRLWCMHVSGMDEVHAAPDRATAQLWAAQFTVLNQRWRPNPHPFDPVINFTVQQWPWSAKEHAKDLPRSIEQNTFPVDPFASVPV